MTEFAIGLASFSLLLLGSISIAGHQEVQRRLAISARESAYSLAWTADRRRPEELARQATWQQMDDEALVNAVGRDRSVSLETVGAAIHDRPEPERAQAAVTTMLLPLQAAGGFFDKSFDLASDRLLSGEIRVDIAARSYLPAPFDQDSLPLGQSFALLTDAWNAAGPDHVQRRVAGLVPTRALNGLQAIWRPVLAPLALLEPSLQRLCFGLIEPDRVPEDRLGSGRTPLPGRCP